MLWEQMISRIEYLHSRGIIHRDIKPHNFLMGVDANERNLYIMDFGLSKRYLDSATGDHIPQCKKKGLTGTARYTSVNVHNGVEPSRRDDLISVGYVALHLIIERLPWQGIQGKSKQLRLEMISLCKSTTRHQDLCVGLPEEFVKYFEYCYSLGYDDTPDYAYLIQLIRSTFDREGFADDKLYDWLVPDWAGRSVPDKKSRRKKHKLASNKRKRAKSVEVTTAT